ncbi:putative Uncharacterized methyltransferase-like protein SPBC21C3.07c [Glarea lozoyensis 74030]|uniref:tRNA N(3)-methylcytidine methyltransferase n=1 Tax=Glarea lozoyensis (strain ATCC 74030 / MF5533) TaxID=1104152 RepID=H0EU96_GLAL7|nr:putative Uncharacterized methyltransferase-like protein SPBC21C3.07c [Glarea lozoyensis 74030]
MDVSSSKQESVAIPDLSTLTLAAGEALVATDPAQTGETPPHLSHDPENNLKRSDPFQFGSRYLSEKDNVFEFNAWDHVETDDTYKEYAEQQYAKQREAPVSDFDKTVEVIRENEAYDTKNIQADVWDAAGDDLPPGLEPGTVDFVLMIFIFSALSPSQWKQAVQNIYKLLKPGGEVLFRDYGRGDLAQVRFKKGRYLEENFYIRGDGTRVYFFEKDELIDIWTGETARTESVEERVPCFEVVDLGVDRRLLVNRKKELKMYRCWLQGRFRKHGEKPA